MTSDTRYIRMLTLEDADFYSVELQVLQALEDNRAAKTIADICRDFNVDQYDFKDRWGSLLRHNRPGALVEKIKNIKRNIGTPIHDIAREYSYTIGTVRNVLRKLLVKPENIHVRSKENLAHRLMYKNGGSLKEAHAAIGPKRKCVRQRQARSTEDSLSSSSSGSESEEEKPLPGLVPGKRPAAVENASRNGVCKTELPQNGNLKMESAENLTLASVFTPEIDKTPESLDSKSLFDSILSTIDDIPLWLAEDMQHYLPPRAQIQVLSKPSEDYQASCSLLSLDYPLFHRLWKPVLSAIPSNALASVLYLVVMMTRLGYGYGKIAGAIGCAKPAIAAISWNLRLYASPSSGRSFDVALSLLQQCPMKSSKVAEMCGVPIALIHHILHRANRKDTVKQQLQRLGEAVDRVMWLYERGVPVGVIATALGVNAEDLRKAGAEESG